MAKIAYSKLDLKVNDDIITISHVTSKDEMIEFEVKKYLPIEEKMEMVTKIINQSIDDNGFYNPMRVQIFTVLEVVYAYTNLNFTAKQKENIFKLYDQLISTGIFYDIKNAICTEDWKEIENAVNTTIKNIYKYRNSAMGILESVTQEYGELNLDAAEIYQQLADPNNMDFLKNVLSKLG